MNRRIVSCAGFVAMVIGVIAMMPARASAVSLQTHIPLHDGQLELPFLSAHLARYLNLPEVEVVGQVDLRGLVGSRFIAALDESLGKGCDFSITDQALVIAIDPDELPHDVASAKAVVRLFTALNSPDATARQEATYGLSMPVEVDKSRPMIVLVHGLDCNRRNWCAMTDLLAREGFQISYFTYPSDGPLADSSALFARHMRMLNEVYPAMRVDVIAHSMGALVARDYIEGDQYAGGIERLILIALPNHGSKWAGYRLLLEAEEHYYLWRSEPDWAWTWMITDGLGEAGRDLKPDSRFLDQLNARPRRADVRYTIIAGSHHPAARVAGNCLDRTAAWIPDRVSHWWGVRHVGGALERNAARLHDREGESDGPVRIASTHLDGVDDFILLPGDHTTLYYGAADKPPVAWAVVKDRLSR